MARRGRRVLGQVILMGAAGSVLIAATTIPRTVKGVSYRLRVQNTVAGMVMGGAPGGDAGGGGGGGGGFPGGGGGGPGGGAQLIRVDLAGDRAKVEFQLGQPPGTGVTDYFLMLLDSNKVYRVSPDAQTYTDAQLGGGRGAGGRGGNPGGGGGGGRGGDNAAAGAARGRGNAGGGGGGGGGDNAGGRGGRGGGGMNPQTVLNDAVVTGFKTTFEELGASEVIDTRATRKYKITVDYDFKLYGQPRVGKTVTEIWAVDFAGKVINPFEAAAITGDTMSIADIARRTVAEAKKIPGVHVKTVTTRTVPISSVAAVGEVEMTTVGGVPQTMNLVQTTTITALKEADIDEAIFKIPAEFKKVAGFGRGGQ